MAVVQICDLAIFLENLTNETEKQYILNKNMQPGYIPRESLDNFWAFAPQL